MSNEGYKRNIRDNVVDYAQQWINHGMVPEDERDVLISLLENVCLISDDRIVRELLFRVKSQHADVKVRREVLKSNGITVEKLYEMAEDEKANIRYNVAVHPMATIDLLEKLSTDPTVSVRIGVARSLIATAELLTFLSKDKHASVLLAVAKNPNATPNILEELSKVDNLRHEGILNAVASHLNTPSNILEMLANTQLEKLEERINDFYYINTKILMRFAQNPNTPITILQRLVNLNGFYSASEIRRYARKNLEKRS